METELVGSTQLLTDERPGSDKPLTAYEQSQVPIENPSVNEQPNNTPIENPPVNEQPNNTPIEKPGFVGTYKKYIVIGLIVLLILLVIFAVLSFTVWEVTPFGIGLSVVAIVPIFMLMWMKKKYYGASNGGVLSPTKTPPPKTPSDGGVLGGLENNNQILAFNLSDYNHIY